MKTFSLQNTETAIHSEEVDLKNTEKALLNILEDYSEEKNRSENNQRALLNILDDYSSEKANMENTQRAVLNILEDYSEEKANMENTQRAVLNILEDYSDEKGNLENTQRAVLNILEDYSDEKGKVKNINDDLISVNKELEAFSYSVSHDLRAPLRAINGFSKILYEDYASKLDAEGIGMLNIISDNSKKMEELIDALLAFSKLGRRELSVSEINMTELVPTVREEEMRGQSDKTEFIINELPAATGDIVLTKQVWINLVSNAIKYSQHIPKARIEIGSYYKDNLIVYYVKDNGAGFDMQYYDKLFGVFQRLHSQEEFIGTGIGLSIAEKVINRHGGSVWAESKLNEGSCFYFSLPNISNG